jgi:hypothetical protein
LTSKQPNRADIHSDQSAAAVYSDHDVDMEGIHEPLAIFFVLGSFTDIIGIISPAA